MKYLVLIVALFAIPGYLYSQSVFSGVVIDEDNDHLVKSVTIFLEKNQIELTLDNAGRFSIPIENIRFQIDTLTVSGLRITEQKIAVSLISSDFITIKIHRNSTELDEVMVVSLRKSTDSALLVLNNALKHKKKNYIDDNTLFNGFYREILLENTKALKLNECVFDLFYTKYSDPGNSKKSFDSYWDDYYESSKYKPRYPLSYFAQHWPLFISPQNEITILESRVSASNGNFNEGFKTLGDPLGGPLDLLSMDNVKFNFHFLDKKNISKYIYYIARHELVDDTLECYVIRYYPKNIKECYVHNWSKNVRAALYRGEIFISKDDYTIVKFSVESLNWLNSTSNCDYENSKTGWKLGMNPNKISYTVRYGKSAYGWCLKDIDYHSFHNFDNIAYEWNRQLSIEKFNSSVEHKESDYFLRSESLRYLTTSYNPVFWEEFEKSKLFFPESKKNLMNLERISPLNSQFMLINQDVKEISRPEIDRQFIRQYDSLPGSVPSIQELEEHNDYSNKIAQKLSEYESKFISKARQVIDYRNVMDRATETKNVLSTKIETDSTGNFFFWELMKDSTYTRVFNITDFKKDIQNASLQSIKIVGKYIVCITRSLDTPYKELFIFEKGTNLLIKRVMNINEFIPLEESFIYTKTTTNNNRSYQCILSGFNGSEVILREEQRIEYEIEIQESISGKYIFIYHNSLDNNTVYIFDKSKKSISALIDKEYGYELYSCNHFKEENFFTLSCNGLDSRMLIMEINSNNSLQKIYSTNNLIEDFLVVDDQILFTEYLCFNMELKQLKISTKKVATLYSSNSPVILQLDKALSNNEKVLFTISGAVLPESTVEIDLKTKKTSTIKSDEFSHAFKNDYKTEVLYAETDFGVKIPILVTYDKTAIKNTIKGLMLEVYGAYGNPDFSVFDEERIVYMSEGFVMARIGVRGSGTLGRKWYVAGKKDSKSKSISDFVIATKFLQELFQISSPQTFAKGVSAGGLIMGGLVNDYSDLYGCIILDRPFLDPYNMIQNDVLVSSTLEYQEWGNPKISSELEYLKRISPSQHIPDKINTNLYFRASFLDYMTPTNQIYYYYNKCLEVIGKDNLSLLRINFDQGHNIISNYKRSGEEFAFINYLLSNRLVK